MYICVVTVNVDVRPLFCLRSYSITHTKCTDDAAGWYQPAASSVHCTTSCKHSLVLLRMGEIIAQKHAELTEIIHKQLFVASSWLFILLYQ